MMSNSKCDKLNCTASKFSSNNRIELNSNIYIINISSEEYYINDNNYPIEVILCDGCSEQTTERIKLTCLICKKRMIDEWIKDKNENHVCRFCIKDPFDVDEVYSDELYNLMCDYNDIGVFFQENRKNEELIDFLDRVIKSEYEKEIKLEYLRSIFPNLNHDTLDTLIEHIDVNSDAISRIYH